MLKLYDGMSLYHGSYCEVRMPDLAKCAKGKDFGRGFYLTSSKEQAVKFLKTSIVKAVTAGLIEHGQDFGYVAKFEFVNKNNMSVHVFHEADYEWLHCVAAHRKKRSFPDVVNKMDKFDIIGGKIADDTTNAVLAAYVAGAFGAVGSRDADDFCIRQLLPNNLKDQYCFKTKAALDCLRFMESEQIWLKK